MACDPHVLREIPLFALLDDEEAVVLAEQVDLVHFAPRQRIFRINDPGGEAYATLSGEVQVTTIDDDHQDVIVDQPGRGEFFGLASMLDETPHQTSATAVEATSCVRVHRNDILVLLQRKPHAGMDILTVLGRQFHAAQQLIRARSLRNPNEMIESEASSGEKVADAVAGFGGSWTFIALFLLVLLVYTGINLLLRSAAWDPYPFILLNLFLSMLAALQAPVIMMSQNRQDTKDRLRGELDYNVNRRAEIEIQGLARKLNLLDDRMADLDRLIRDKLSEPGATGQPQPVH
jgi:uncharacterized membrane protein